MCGFVGYISCVTDDTCFGARAAISAEHQQKALDTLEYRGPDAEGQWQDQHAWLGHRRLSIVDTSARGNQPMEFGNLVIAFNGMIYNFRDIRQTLIQKGYKFHTETDTEIILAGWAEWQQDLLPRLYGMFAFVLWDKATKRLVLARDRFGKKPLYFRNWRGTFAFGSRFDAIEALTETAQLSHEALSWLLTLKYIPDPFSASDEIQKLPAGHVL
ncbi:asparagine synthetase B, partial [Alphaproteobacteria bacterium]|nr:asparagine synthetase B [Alphaproteobacteria bacterium]